MKRALIVAMCGLMLTGCGTGNREADMRTFLSEYEATVKPLETRMNKAYWDASITGDEAKYKEVAAADLELTRYHSNKAAYQKVKSWLSGDIKDSELRRELEEVLHAYEANQGDEALLKQIIDKQAEVEQRFNTFRAELDGTRMSDNQLKTILKTETKDMDKRRKAWEATKQIGNQVAEDVIELARLRNQLARSLGYANYFEMSLKISEMDPETLVSLFDELDVMIRDEYATVKQEIDQIQAKKFGLTPEELRPWHYEDPFFQEGISLSTVDLDRYYADQDIVDIASRFYGSIGLDVTDILERSSLYEQEGKMQHAFCTHIDRSGDVRVLCNVKPNAEWMDTMLHELGHAVYDKYLGDELPFALREPAHSFTTEAIAMLFGRQAKNPQFLVEYCGVDPAEAEKVGSELYKSTKFQQLVFSRWCQVMMRFEKALYEDPDRGVEAFNKLWWDLKEKYQLLKRPEGRDNPDWASKIHISAYPVYYHNYMLGELLASQLQAHLAGIIGSEDVRQVALADHPEVGKFLKEKVFAPGARYPWNEMIERATGEKLTPAHYRDQFISE